MSRCVGETLEVQISGDRIYPTRVFLFSDDVANSYQWVISTATYEWMVNVPGTPYIAVYRDKVRMAPNVANGVYLTPEDIIEVTR